MKKIALFTSLVLICFSNLKSQITLDNAYVNKYYMSLDKFHLSGYKYVYKDIPNLKIEIYNVNHTLFKIINIPPQPDPIQQIQFISENLFDLDSQIEYAITTYSNTVSHSRFVIYKETGAQMFFRDSASYGVTNGFVTSAFNNTDAVFYDGIGTKLRITIYKGPGNTREEIYSLPGTIPCASCTGGIVSKVPGQSSEENDALFFPNPATQYLKLKYRMPDGYKIAEMKIYDSSGKLVEEFKVTDVFDFIYLPTNYNNGLYLYSLIVDGKIVKTEKIILNK